LLAPVRKALIAIDFVVFFLWLRWVWTAHLAACLVLGRRPGVARRASNFLLLRQKKVTKEKATPSLRPLRGAKGQTCVGAVAGCAVELALRCARRSDSHGESVHEAWALRRPCHPATAPPQAQPAGVGSQTSNSRTATRAIAALGRACAARGACARELGPSAAEARVDVWFPLPLWMRRGAQGLADQGSRLSERSEFERDPAKPEHRRLPRSEAQGTQTVGSPFLWFLSFGDAKERDSPAGRLPASALEKGMWPNESTQHQTLQNQ
jgi:hypothetical protein